MSLTAGAYLSFTINNTSYDSGLGAQSITSVYHKNDFGFILGAEHDLYKNIGLRLNYIVGAKNIWLNDVSGTYKYTNRALQLTLIYKFAS